MGPPHGGSHWPAWLPSVQFSCLQDSQADGALPWVGVLPWHPRGHPCAHPVLCHTVQTTSIGLSQTKVCDHGDTKESPDPLHPLKLPC